MENTTSDLLVEEYLSEIKEFTVKLSSDPETLRQLLGYIEGKLDQVGENSETTAFLKGEYAFYSGQYEQSLKYYLMAKNIPNFEFYCFRSSAFTAKEMGNHEKATSYAEKAKRMISDDPTLDKLEEPANDISNNPYSGFFASQKTAEPSSTEELTKKLYSLVNEDEKVEEEIEEEVVKEEEVEEELLSIPEPQDKLEERIHAHQTAHEKAILDYVESEGKREEIQNFTLSMISGWKAPYTVPNRAEVPEAGLMTRVLQSNIRGSAASGFYIRWNNKGFVINPGEGFLETFHQQGFHVSDIDYVIVTRNESEAYSDTKRIYHLNYQVNKVSNELHVIHYYLNQTCYQDLSRILKPNFKQERNAIHSLELFIDSPEVEKVQITPEVLLHYFPIYQRGSSLESFDRISLSGPSLTAPALGIRLDLTSDETPLVAGSDQTVKLGYLSGASWSPLLASNLGHCDVMVTGFGHTGTQDYSKVNYNDECLGYYGTFSLLEDLDPKVLFCTEFDGLEGDIRLDIVKKMRQERATKHTRSGHPSVVLPADTGLCLNLKSLRVKCSITKEWLDPTLVQVVKTADSFGTLRYLSPDSCL